VTVTVPAVDATPTSDSERTMRPRTRGASTVTQLVKSWLRPGLRRALRRSETLSGLYAAVKGRIEERDSARWSGFYEAEAARRGLTVPGREELRRAIAARLTAQGLRLTPRKIGDLHVFAVDRFAPFDEQMDFLVSLRKFGRTSVFSWGDHGFDHYSKTWLWERDRMNQAMLAAFRRAHAERPVDVVIGCLSGYTTNPDTLADMSRAGAVVVNICLDDMTTFPGPVVGGRWYSAAALAATVDLTLTNAPRSVIKYYVHGGLAMFWPQGALPEVHLPYDVPFDYDVSFCGYRYPTRARLVSALGRAGIEVATFGIGWEHRPLAQEEMVKLWSRSRVNLGFSTAANTRHVTNLKGRDFQIPCAGGLYLTQQTSDLPLVYEIGEEIVVYDDATDCAEKIRWLLDSPEEAHRIRRAGRARALRDHTWDRRFTEAFEIAGLLESDRSSETAARD
jgi:hypothetical protein